MIFSQFLRINPSTVLEEYGVFTRIFLRNNPFDPLGQFLSHANGRPSTPSGADEAQIEFAPHYPHFYIGCIFHASRIFKD